MQTQGYFPGLTREQLENKVVQLEHKNFILRDALMKTDQFLYSVLEAMNADPEQTTIVLRIKKPDTSKEDVAQISASALRNANIELISGVE